MFERNVEEYGLVYGAGWQLIYQLICIFESREYLNLLMIDVMTLTEVK